MDMDEEWITGNRYVSFDPYIFESIQDKKTEEDILQAVASGNLYSELKVQKG